MYYEISSDLETQGVVTDGSWRSYPDDTFRTLKSTEFALVILVLGVPETSSKGEMWANKCNSENLKSGTAIRNKVRQF